ncbi:MAG: hypothetical protein CBC48_02110 [bacterium TMED88]|nr:(2Fe-2S)-binding protein [Deltaproteobacteria bacterium]OUV36517.1 MAG: hypothetical protein CBC48_02110 [bacterium TMED88]
MALCSIQVNVNGTNYQSVVEPRLSLADFLRHELGLTGTHVGCEHGVCGICNVLVDGRSVRACLLLAVQVDGQSVETVEGLAEGEKLHPIQQAFMDEQGLQCGFCTPGFIMSLKELLDCNPSPSEDEIKDVLGGSICRCTGYAGILRAVQSAVAKMGGGQPSSAD